MPIQDEASNAILDETGAAILDESEAGGGESGTTGCGAYAVLQRRIRY